MTFGRRAYVFLCWAFLTLLPVQFLLAGMGVMGGDLEVHMMFGGMILHIVIPALMLVVALIGRAWSLAGWAFALFALLTLQIAMVGIGREADAVAHLRRAIAILEREPPGPELARAYSRMAGDALIGSRFEECREAAERALALAQDLGLREEIVRSRQYLGAARCELGGEGLSDTGGGAGHDRAGVWGGVRQSHGGSA